MDWHETDVNWSKTDVDVTMDTPCFFHRLGDPPEEKEKRKKDRKKKGSHGWRSM